MTHIEWTSLLVYPDKSSADLSSGPAEISGAVLLYYIILADKQPV